jgi:hypothetical protein
MIDRLNEVKGNPYHTHGEGNKDKDGFTVEPQNVVIKTVELTKSKAIKSVEAEMLLMRRAT